VDSREIPNERGKSYVFVDVHNLSNRISHSSFCTFQQTGHYLVSHLFDTTPIFIRYYTKSIATPAANKETVVAIVAFC
jgi:hypothetical protein